MEALLKLVVADADGSKNVCIDTSPNGRLFILNACGCLWSADARLLQLAPSLECVATRYKLVSDDALRFDTYSATSIHVSPGGDGEFVLVCGSVDKGDESRTRVLMVDLTACRPMQAPASSSGSTGSGVLVEHQQCRVLPVDSLTFQAMPGLEVLRAAWHPWSREHFGVLTSDNTFSLFCTSDVTLAEQSFRLRRSQHASVGLPRSGGSSEDDWFVDFAYGAGWSWDAFAVYFLARSGRVYCICPVAPFGSFIKLRQVNQMLQVAEEFELPGFTWHWLSDVTALPEVSESAEQRQEHMEWRDEHRRVQLLQHFYPDQTVALQGPLSTAVSQSAGVVGRLHLLSSEPMVASNAVSESVVTAAVVLSHSEDKGHAYVHVLEQCTPAWGAGEVHYVAGDNETVRAVKQTVTRQIEPDEAPPVPLWAGTAPITKSPPASAHESDMPVWAASCSQCTPAVLLRYGNDLFVLDVFCLQQLSARDLNDSGDELEQPSLTKVSPPRAAHDAGIAGVAPLLHVLSGDAALIVLSDGRAMSVRISGAYSTRVMAAAESDQLATPSRDKAGLSSDRGMATEKFLQQKYSGLASPQRLPSTPPQPSGNEAGIEALHKGIVELQEVYVEHCHAALDIMKDRFEVVAAALERVNGKDATDKESEDLRAVDKLLKLAQQNNKALETRLSRISTVQNFLDQRVDLQAALWLTNSAAPVRLHSVEVQIEADVARRRTRLPHLKRDTIAVISQVREMQIESGAPDAAATSQTARGLQDASDASKRLEADRQALSKEVEELRDLCADVNTMMFGVTW